MRVALLVFTAIAIAVIWFTNQWLTERFTAATKNRAEVRQALYTGNLVSELQRNSVVPLLLSRDPVLIGALNSDDFSQSSQRLISVKDEIGAASIMMLDADGPHGGRDRSQSAGLTAPIRALFRGGFAVERHGVQHLPPGKRWRASSTIPAGSRPTAS